MHKLKPEQMHTRIIKSNPR